MEDLPDEKWKPIVGWEGYYDVSNMGRVRSYRARAWKGEPSDTPQSLVATNAHYVTLRKPGGVIFHANIDILVLSAFTCPAKPNHIPHHLDGNTRNNRLTNLDWIPDPRTMTVLPGERWAPVRGFDGYEVSTMGRVRSYFRGRKITTTPRIIGQKRTAHRYQIITFLKNGKHHSMTLHTVILEAFVGPRPQGMVAMHLNDIGHDNRLENLKWGTWSENNRQSACRGEQHPCAKLTATQVVEIVREHQSGYGSHRLCRKYGVSKSAIESILHGKTWVWLTGIKKSA